MHRLASLLVFSAFLCGAYAKSEMIVYNRDSSTVILPLARTDSVTFTSGLLIYYPFSGSAADRSGNSVHGTPYGPTLTTDMYGDSNSAYYFYGTYSNIVITGLKFAAAFSITARIMSEGSAGMQCIVGNSDTAQDMGVSFSLNLDNKLQVEFGDSSGGWPYASLVSASTVPLNEWHFVAAVRNGAEIKIFIDGVVDTTGACGTNEIADMISLMVGGSQDNFHGKIDDVRIYDTPLTDDNVRALSRACKIIR